MKIYVVSYVCPGHVQGGNYSKQLVLDALRKKGHAITEFNSVKPFKRAIKASRPDLVLHYNIKWLVGVYNICNTYSVPLIPTLNSYITSLTSTHVMLHKSKFGKPFYKSNLLIEFSCALHDHRFNYAERLLNMLSVPYRYWRMKKRLKVLNKVSRIIVVGKTIKDFLVKHGVNNNINVVIGPVENSFLGINLPDKKAEKTLLIVAEEYIKGLHIALEAFTKAGLDNVKLLQVGDNPIKKIIAPYKDKQNIIFSKTVPYEKMEEHYKNAYITLFPSIWFEPSGRVWEESVTAGCPVIAFNNRGGASDFLENNKTALLVDYDIDAFAGAVKKLVNDEKLRNQLSSNCIKYAKKNLVVDAILPRLIKIYEETADVR